MGILSTFLLAPYQQPTKRAQAIDYIQAKTKHYSLEYRQRIADCIIKYSFMYDLDPYLFARQIWVESRFNRHAVSSKKARGLSQIIPYHWSHILFYIDSGKLGKHIRKRGIKDIEKYFHRVGYGIEAGAFIMSFLKLKHGSHEKALLFYGYRREAALKYLSDPYKSKYVRAIMGRGKS